MMEKCHWTGCENHLTPSDKQWSTFCLMHRRLEERLAREKWQEENERQYNRNLNMANEEAIPPVDPRGYSIEEDEAHEEPHHDAGAVRLPQWNGNRTVIDTYIPPPRPTLSVKAAMEALRPKLSPIMGHVLDVANNDAKVLQEKEQSYGDSWKKRGGVGAYMMACRKFDRLEEHMSKVEWDIFKAIEADSREEGVLDDIRDLRRYLLLIEAEMVRRGVVK